MNEITIPLIYPEGYAVKGFDVIGRWGRPLKEGYKGNIKLQPRGGRTISATRYKIVWAARHNVDLRKIPKGYSFYLDGNGELKCDTFSNRMSQVAKIRQQEVKVKREDYAFTEQYAHIAIQMCDGDVTARTRLYCLINSKRDEFIRYARRTNGGVSEEKAIHYTDEAIIYTYELICSGRYYVPSPVGSVKGRIYKLIADGRKKQQLTTTNNYGKRNLRASPSRN